MKATEIVSKLLTNATDIEVCKELVAEDATYVSLNYENPDLKAVERWCGTHTDAGPAAIQQVFVDVGTWWEILDFQIYTMFAGDNAMPSKSPGPDGTKEGTNVAVFGKFKYKSRSVGKISDSPFCVWAKVDEKKDKVTYMQFMEDTLSSSASFRKSGKMVYATDLDGGEVVIGDN